MSTVVSLDNIDAVRSHAEALRNFYAELPSSNIFYHPDFLCTALSLLKDQTSWRLLLVLSQKSNGSSSVANPAIQAVFPIERAKSFARVPVPHWSMLTHPFGIDGSPLLREGSEAEALESVLSWLRGRGERFVFDFPRVNPSDHWFQVLLKVAEAQRLPCSLSDCFDRPEALTGNGLHLNKRSLKDARRKMHALERRGELSTEHLHGAGDDFEDYIQEFIELEVSGWKGRAKTALGQHPVDCEFFRRSLSQLASQKLTFLSRLLLDGQCIATRCSLLSNTTLVCFKTTFSELYAACSPGLILEIAHLQEAMKRFSIERIDSYADPANQLYQRLFTERRLVASAHLGLSTYLSTTLFGVVSAGRRIKDRLRARKGAALGALK